MWAARGGRQRMRRAFAGGLAGLGGLALAGAVVLACVYLGPGWLSPPDEPKSIVEGEQERSVPAAPLQPERPRTVARSMIEGERMEPIRTAAAGDALALAAPPAAGDHGSPAALATPQDSDPAAPPSADADADDDADVTPTLEGRIKRQARPRASCRSATATPPPISSPASCAGACRRAMAAAPPAMSPPDSRISGCEPRR